MEVSMKRRLAVLLAITLAVSPLWTVPARAVETAETGVTFDAEGAADTEPEIEPETKPETEPEIEPETKPETEPEIEPETEPETKPETEPETEADVTDEDKGESAASGVTLDPETAAETEPEEITESEVDATANDAKMSGIVTDLDDSGNVLHHYIDGEMVKGAWASITISGKAYKFYFDENGNPLVGMQKVAGKVYYFADKNYPAFPRGSMLTGFRKINGYKYYFGSDGVRKTGFQVIGGKKYYMADARLPGARWAAVQTGVKCIKGKWYSFNGYGVMRTGWFKNYNNLLCYYTSYGYAGKEGWRKHNDKWFYIKANGIARIGWAKIGDDYYYLDKTKGGRRLYGPSPVGSKRYYFDSEGRRAVTRGWKTYKGNYYYSYSDGTIAVDTTVNGFKVDKYGKASLDSMDWKAQDYSSSTNYLILVNRSLHKVAVYRRSEGLWSPIKKWYCGDGKSSTPTIEGSFTVGIKMLYFDSGSARCWYATQFCGNYLFHSVLYYQNSWPSSVMDGRVGVGVSHGCVRLQVDNAEWIYDNIPRGTKVIVYH